jgi:hypothetical protein
MNAMNRREAVIKMAALLGGSLALPRLLTSTWAASEGRESHGFSGDEVALLDEIGETIIPATDIPGAKAVGIGAFMAMMVHDCYEPKEQESFRAGLAKLSDDFRARHGRAFEEGAGEERTAFLNELDAEQRRYTAEKKGKDVPEEKAAASPEHHFRMMKDLTVLGYFSSEIGCTQALRYLETPGRYDGNMPYQKGDKAWYSL